MSKLSDPHPGLDVAVEPPIGPDGMAHRRGTHLVEDRVHRGQMEEKPITPVVAACGVGVQVKSLSWGFAQAQGVPLCTAAACYPVVE